MIFDLEDVVNPDAKSKVREIMPAALTAVHYGALYKIVRVDGFDTPWVQAEEKSLSGLAADTVLLPKVKTVKGH